MKVHSDAAFNGREFGVELTDQDGMLGCDDWDDLSLIDRYKWLAKTADLLVVDYMAREGVITPDYARQRMAEIRARK